MVLLLCWQLSPVLSQSGTGTVSFSLDQIVVQEDVAGPYETVSIPLTREGGTSGAIAVSIEVR